MTTKVKILAACAPLKGKWDQVPPIYDNITKDCEEPARSSEMPCLRRASAVVELLLHDDWLTRSQNRDCDAISAKNGLG